jgi:transcriptional regulator with GAF, ATPase, and Fis domain
MNGLTWKAEDPGTSRQAANLLRDEAFESRLSSLRDVAVELLNAVDYLKQTTSTSDQRLNLEDEVRKFEADLIRAALVRTGGNQARAARLLGVKHTTLNAKIKRLQLLFGGETRADAQSAAQIAA